MFIRNETPKAFFSFLVARITKLMDGGSVLVVKYLGLGSLDVAPCDNCRQRELRQA